ncbi:MAG: phenylalanine--tRNA ligase subunit beta [Chloroflexota bacterium]
MKLPISWLKDFIDLKGLPVEEIARELTLAGLEVGEIIYAGLPMPELETGQPHEFRTRGIAWDRDKIVVAEVREVMPHPNADRLTLLDLYDGQQQHTVLTGAPNIFQLKGQGKLAKPLKVAYAREGATLYDGHADGLQLMTLKRAKIRGVESYSMACSEKELGISDDHEGIILLDADAPVGRPLADYIGDAVLDIEILPNMARNANVLGVARELAALTGRKLNQPQPMYKTRGSPVKPLVSIQITEPELNPRFVLGLIRDVRIGPSPYEVQRRLKLAGMRPINSIVDATNYAMLELGQPLHAFDFDALQRRAAKGRIKIITRTAKEGEMLETLDGMRRTLSPLNVLVCDEMGPLSIAGVMGGMQSEVTASTKNVLLEGAAWNYINIRRTARQHNLPSEASFRFSRCVHPALALAGVQRGLQYMSLWSGGSVAPGLVDEYRLKPRAASVTFTPADVRRLLGIELRPEEIVRRLRALEFKCKLQTPPKRGKGGEKAASPNTRITVTAPPHRLDIGEGIIGLADVMEELARLVGYDRIPSTNMANALPPQIGNPTNEWEERLRDLLSGLGFTEVVSYRLTSPEREAKIGVSGGHLRIANPVAPERSVLRRSLLASVLDDLERNVRWSDSLAFFEIGPVFEPGGNDLPREHRRLALAMTGLRHAAAWDMAEASAYDVYDLKGRLELLLRGLRLSEISFTAAPAVQHLHPGKAAEITAHGRTVGAFGELHPMTRERYDLGQSAVLVAEVDLDALRQIEAPYQIAPVAEFPPVLEDIAIIVDESIPAARVEALIREAGGPALVNVRLFDLYRGEQIGAGKKSLAYGLTYQAADKTLTDGEAAAVRNKVVKRLEQELGATLRG